MKENTLETDARKEAIANGWKVRKIMFVGHKGGPDRLFVKSGRIVFMEIKRPGGKPRPSQSSEIRELRDAGAEVYVCDTMDRIRKCLGILTPPT